MKRFYTDTAAAPFASGWTVLLDGKPVRTPARAALLLPTQALAEAVAAEWAEQGPNLRPETMRLTGLANAAVDRVAPDPRTFADALAAYAGSDTLLYRADGPPALVALQLTTWDPIVTWTEQRCDIAFVRVTGLLYRPQSSAALARVTSAYRGLSAFDLAALHPVVTVTGSAILGLALAEGACDATVVWAAGQLDELWQAGQYAPEPLAEATRASNRAALDSGARLLALARDAG